MKRKQIFFVGLIILGTLLDFQPALAQRHEFGIGAGVMNYAGDMSRGYAFNHIQPGGRLFYRYNINPIISLRTSLSGGLLSGSDANPIDVVADQRNASFKSTVVELSADFQFNFLDIKSEKTLNWWSPYIFFGIGGAYFNGEFPYNDNFSKVTMVVPFGGGFKMDISKNLSLGIEMGVRKTFSDHLDGVSDGDLTNKNFRYGNKYDKDWYNMFAVSLSYTLYSVNCPFDFY